MAGRLAAILYADLVGFSALEAWDATAAGKRSAAFRDLVAAEVATSGGRVAESAPSSALVEFPGAGVAVGCAEKILQRVATRNAGLPPDERFAVTLGVAQGEVVEEGGALLGLPVRTAVAAHTLADPGGIGLTEAVHRAVRGTSSLRGALLRPAKFDHLPDPVRVFVVPPAGASYLPWLIRKRRLAPLVFLGAIAAAAAVAGLVRLLPAPAPPPAPKAPAAPPRTTRIVESYDEPARISRYDGGGSTIAFSVQPAADGSRELTFVTGGENGWWGLVLFREHDWTGFDTILIPARAAKGTTFRVMVTDDDQPFRAAVTAGTTASVLRIPFSLFAPDAGAKKPDGTPADGRFNLAAIKQIQIMHADPAGSDTLWLGAISVEGPAAQP